MKRFNKILSVGLSLAMCASMVAPAFAASFTDLQNVIKGNGKYDGEEIVREDDTITLKGNVEREENESSITISKGDITIDLNGYIIDGSGESGSVIKVSGSNTSLTLTDGSEEGSGKVTGGSATWGGGIYASSGTTVTIDGVDISGNDASYGGGIYGYNATIEITDADISGNTAISGGGIDVSGTSSSVTIKDTSITGNTATNGGGIYAGGGSNVTIDNAAITDNTAINGGGVYGSNSTVTIKETDISDNEAVNSGNGGKGGGIYASGSAVDIEDSTISNNTAVCTDEEKPYDLSGGGGIYSYKSTVTVEDTVISDNTAGKWGGGIYAYSGSNVTVQGGSISDNEAGVGGGVCNDGSTFIMKSGLLYKNTADVKADDVYNYSGATLQLMAAGPMNATGDDGKPITGWYYDGAGDRWGVKYTDQSNYATGVATPNGGLALKAAHDQYFWVTYVDGEEILLKQELVNGTEFPKIEDPTRSGYTFEGWLVDGIEFDAEGTLTVTSTLTLTALWRPIPVVVIPGGETDTGDVTIGETAIPLAAGPVTRAEFIDYLWRHEGEPASDGVCTFTDVPADHEYVLALAWAEQNGVAAAYEDGSFEPDELVTVAAVREFLGNFAQSFGMAMPELAALTGDDDEAVINCAEVIAEFFGE